MSDIPVTGLVKAGLWSRRKFRNWRNKKRAEKGEPIKGATSTAEVTHMDGLIWQFVEKGIRHAMGTVGGLLIAQGIATEADVATISGAAVAVAAFLWSVGRAIYRKRKGVAPSGMVSQ